MNTKLNELHDKLGTVFARSVSGNVERLRLRCVRDKCWKNFAFYQVHIDQSAATIVGYRPLCMCTTDDIADWLIENKAIEAPIAEAANYA